MYTFELHTIFVALPTTISLFTLLFKMACGNLKVQVLSLVSCQFWAKPLNFKCLVICTGHCLKGVAK